MQGCTPAAGWAGPLIFLSTLLLPTCMLVYWFISRSPRPPLKTKGSHLVQGCYSPLLYGLLGFIPRSPAPPQKNGSELRGTSVKSLFYLGPQQGLFAQTELCLQPFIGAILIGNFFRSTSSGVRPLICNTASPRSELNLHGRQRTVWWAMISLTITKCLSFIRERTDAELLFPEANGEQHRSCGGSELRCSARQGELLTLQLRGNSSARSERFS